ncbi:hypothetical protein [Burkholderia cenocepacia]|uniref:hypothetical protein n=1 Tax=Burkholderia cenocepacia TaxID=95486 RepID=UPI002DDCA745|nr:hypothetical protein [Burkholderia cenocepacia]MEC4773171.1 hypothetical protein [Burkholderia cenocepacia]
MMPTPAKTIENQPEVCPDPAWPRRGRPTKTDDERFRDRIRTIATMHALALRTENVRNANQFAEWFDLTMWMRHPRVSWGTARSGKWTKNFAGDATLTRASIDHLHELFPDVRFYDPPDRARRRRDVELFYPPASGRHQSAYDLFEFGPGCLWRALWGCKDDLSALWDIYAGCDDGVSWGEGEEFRDVVGDLEMKLWSNSRAGVQIEAEDLGRAIVLYRLQWEAMRGDFRTAVSIHLLLWVALVGWLPWLQVVQIWGDLREYFMSREQAHLVKYPEYRKFLETRHGNDPEFFAVVYASNPFLYRPSEDDHSAMLASLWDLPSGRRKGI